jgi:tyrosyl-tRNA synthetase
MFGKVMSIPDELMGNYFELLTDRPRGEIAELLDAGKMHPRQAKVTLAKDVVAWYHGAAAAEAAAAEFDRIHAGAGGGGLPDDIPGVAAPREWFGGDGVPAVKLIVHCRFSPSNSEAKKLIAEGGVRLNGRKLADPKAAIKLNDGDILQRGKRRFVRLAAE